MHTIIIISAGLLLLGVCAAVGRLARGPEGMLRAFLWFLPLWGVGAAINMYVGIKHAGYSFSEELPIFLIVFGVPSMLALGLRWWLRRAPDNAR
ncbi:MAG: hypothetical protein KIT72_08555 [Polyangiaceae bacterium]|nr:hypothetical protein [Polyangiaceae bacterium]MCW5790458.1 hypothetical protein [Polyangiaceae bacterium]